MSAANGPLPITVDALFARAVATFDRARASAGGGDVDVRIAGRAVRLSYAGGGMTAITRALAADVVRPEPARPAPARPELTIRMWDAASTGVSLPPGSWPEATPGPLGRIAELCSERFQVAFEVHSALLTVIDLEAREAIAFVPDVDALPLWERAGPLRLVFASWAAAEGMRVCHAAAVGDDTTGVLMPAPQGSGKSTTTLACLQSGLRCVGDDYVIVEPGAPPIAHALYSSASLHTDHAARYPSLLARTDARGDTGNGTKITMFTEHGDGPKIGGSVALRAIAVPRVGRDPETIVAPVPGARALQALAPSSLLQLDQRSPDAFAALAELCRSLPTYELVLGRDVRTIAPAVRDLLEELRAPVPRAGGSARSADATMR